MHHLKNTSPLPFIFHPCHSYTSCKRPKDILIELKLFFNHLHPFKSVLKNKYAAYLGKMDLMIYWTGLEELLRVLVTLVGKNLGFGVKAQGRCVCQLSHMALLAPIIIPRVGVVFWRKNNYAWFFYVEWGGMEKLRCYRIIVLVLVNWFLLNSPGSMNLNECI